MGSQVGYGVGVGIHGVVQVTSPSQVVGERESGMPCCQIEAFMRAIEIAICCLLSGLSLLFRVREGAGVIGEVELQMNTTDSLSYSKVSCLLFILPV